jgi:hypothetical protein
VPNGVHGRAPVRLDAELLGAEPPGVTAGVKLDRRVLELACATLEQRAGLPRGHSPDVDAGDVNPVREALRGAGKGEADDDAGQRGQGREDHGAPDEHRVAAERLAAALPDQSR